MRVVNGSWMKMSHALALAVAMLLLGPRTYSILVLGAAPFTIPHVADDKPTGFMDATAIFKSPSVIPSLCEPRRRLPIQKFLCAVRHFLLRKCKRILPVIVIAS